MDACFQINLDKKTMSRTYLMWYLMIYVMFSSFLTYKINTDQKD